MVLLEEGKSPRDLLLPVTETESLELGYCAFSPKGDVLFASFTLQTNGGPATAFGFVEVPLDGSTPRRTLLIQNASISDSDKRNANTFFEFGLSHDGKTLAVSSTGVALVSPEMKTEDCALFLVDLSQPSRKVTKVAIPLPANHVAIGD
jgi:hypothetical protein